MRKSAAHRNYPLRLSKKSATARQRLFLASHPRPNIGNTGLHHKLEPYSGPQSFPMRAPSAQPHDRAFLVVRDERLFLPYGGFRIMWGEEEVGRNLSYPDYDCCQRLLRDYRTERHIGARQAAFDNPPKVMNRSRTGPHFTGEGGQRG